MRIVASPAAMRALAARWRRAGKTVGLVPTMGAFHEGHASLFRRARAENAVVVASVFVNPAQFGPSEDYRRYPRPWSKDLALARREKVDVLFRPSASAMYPPGFQTWVEVEELSKPLCGPFRPGHFRGVATVVLKLLNLAQPTRAYFGRKDFQQWRVVERMARDLDLPVRIVGCPTVREPGGLAMSSRNAYLKPAERRAAREIRRALQAAGLLIKSRSSVSTARVVRRAKAGLARIPGARPDYVAVADPATLEPLSRARKPALIATAVRLGRARLIDNHLVT